MNIAMFSITNIFYINNQTQFSKITLTKIGYKLIRIKYFYLGTLPLKEKVPSHLKRLFLR
jgi:hypothetical protein